MPEKARRRPRMGRKAPRIRHHMKARTMLDLAMLALGLGLFAGAIGYGYVCERL